MGKTVKVIWEGVLRNDKRNTYGIFSTPIEVDKLRKTIELMSVPDCPFERAILPHDVEVSDWRNMLTLWREEFCETYASNGFPAEKVLNDIPAIDIDTGLLRGNGLIIHQFHTPGEVVYNAPLSIGEDYDYDLLERLEEELGVKLKEEEAEAFMLAAHYMESLENHLLKVSDPLHDPFDLDEIKRALQEALQTDYPVALRLFNLHLENREMSNRSTEITFPEATESFVTQPRA